MASGQSLDVFGLKGGDEFMIGRRGAGFAPTLGIVASIITLTTTIVILAK
jgi:TM2 domain-containing membrane protein YozV